MLDKYSTPSDFESSCRRTYYQLKFNQDNSIIVDMYKDKILELRKHEDDDWVPSEFRKKMNRNRIIDDLLD
jgi:hypothetical protein